MRPAAPTPEAQLSHTHNCEEEHETVITQQEANVIYGSLADPGRLAHLQVWRVDGYEGKVQPLLQPVYRALGNRTDH